MSAPARPLRGRRSEAPRWPGLSASFLAGTAVLAATAGLLGWFGRDATTPAPVVDPVPTQKVALGPVNVAVPGTWTKAAAIPDIPDRGAPAMTFAPIPGLSARAVLTLAPFDDATLVPARFRPLLGSLRPSPATLAGMRAWTYQPRDLPNGRIAQVTVAPTSAGSLTAICVARADAWAGAVGCADQIGGAALRGATPLVPSPTLAFRRRLAPAIERLDDRRAELRRRLRAAETPRGQARFAARLGRAYARAAATLAPAAAAPGAASRVAEGLRSGARDYRRLSIAALEGRPARYARARAAIRRSEAALNRALARVR